jgi:hypothetical protein
MLTMAAASDARDCDATIRKTGRDASAFLRGSPSYKNGITKILCAPRPRNGRTGAKTAGEGTKGAA